MLNPTQVLSFLTHPEPDVRELASKYLAALADAAPIETADELWKAIEIFGEYLTPIGTTQAQSFLHTLSKVPQNESSVTKTITLLAADGSDSNRVHVLLRVLEKTPLDLLENHREQILPLMKPGSIAAMEHRFALRQFSAEELWQQFDAFAEQAADAESSSDVDHGAAAHFVEALAKHPDFVIPRAMAVLEDPGDRWWLETWCAELLGELRHAPAIDLLIEKMKIEDADFLRQTAGAALSRMDAATVVPKLETTYPSDNPFDRMAVAESLGAIKHPLAETALLRLLPGEDSPTATTGLCTALCDLCTTDASEEMRKVVQADRYDASVADIKELFITLCKMTGFAPPELDQWKKELVDPVYRKKRRARFLKNFGMTENTFDLFQKYLETGSLGDSDESDEADPLPSPPQPTKPYRREQPKVGRNDPCSCGSGKKFKKCCGK